MQALNLGQKKKKKIEETKNYISEEIKHNDLMSKRHKKDL